MSEIESSSESESVEEASAHPSEEEQQAALPNAQNDTQAGDAVVPPLPYYEVMDMDQVLKTRDYSHFQPSTGTSD